MLLGVHCSVSGGLERAFDEAKELDIDTFQIFTRNQRQWSAKTISEEEKQAYLIAKKNSKVKIEFSHTSYLINLANGEAGLRKKSMAALQAEVERCTALNLAYCVLHPGAAGEQTKEKGIANIAAGLKQVLGATNNSKVMILLENTAGQGSSIGSTFEELAAINKLTNSKRIGFCLDTCHVFAAGYDISTKAGFEDTMNKFDKILGLNNLKVIHTNDSKGDLGSHLDRHENIGKGKLGLEPFKQIMKRFSHIPKVLETPKENNMDKINLKLLRSLA